MASVNNFVFRRAFQVWLLMIFAESLHGIARTVLLAPLVGDFRARQIGVFTGSLIILTIAYFFVDWISAANGFQRRLVGLQWLISTAAFEILLGRLMNLSWERIFSDYDPAHGGLMPLGLLFLFFAPLVAAHLRSKYARRDPRNY